MKKCKSNAKETRTALLERTGTGRRYTAKVTSDQRHPFVSEALAGFGMAGAALHAATGSAGLVHRSPLSNPGSGECCSHWISYEPANRKYPPQ